MDPILHLLRRSSGIMLLTLGSTDRICMPSTCYTGFDQGCGAVTFFVGSGSGEVFRLRLRLRVKLFDGSGSGSGGSGSDAQVLI